MPLKRASESLRYMVAMRWAASMVFLKEYLAITCRERKDLRIGKVKLVA